MLTCEECGAHSVVMAGPLRDGADVCCSECGHLLGTYPAFFGRFVDRPLRSAATDGMGRGGDEPAVAPRGSSLGR